MKVKKDIARVCIYSLSFLLIFFTVGSFFVQDHAGWIFNSVNSGIAGVVVAIVAAILVYLAFTEQRRALELQKMAFEEQKKLNDKQHAIIHFHELFRLIKESAEKVEFDDKKGKKAFFLMEKEFKECFSIVSAYLQKQNYNNGTNIFFEDKVDLAYLFFYYGIVDDDSISKLSSMNFSYLLNNKDVVIKNIIEEFTRYKDQHKDDRERSIYFEGHDLDLCSYYRQMFQTVEDMDKSELFSYVEKYDLIKNIRALMSSQEQALFLYNALSRHGRNWEISKEKIEDRLITKYQFIRNIPRGFFSFENEIRKLFPGIFWENDGNNRNKKEERQNWELKYYGGTQIRLNEKKDSRIIALIPARYDASRFDGKLMRPLRGIPVIRRTYEAVIKMTNSITGNSLFDDVFVVTDSDVIYDEITLHGGKAIRSNKKHNSGSDRIAEAAEQLDADIIINVQGDEPFTKAKSIELLLEEFRKDTHKTIGVTSLMQKLENDEHVKSHNYVKVVVDKDMNALYFSRSVIPLSLNKLKTDYYEHIGVYGFRKEALLQFARTPRGYLEERESVECLRYLENGISLKMVITEYMGIEIDTEEDLVNAEKLLEQQEQNIT